MGPARSAECCEMAALACSTRPVAELPRWFTTAHGPAISDPQRQTLHRDVLQNLWAQREAMDGTDEFDDALEALRSQHAGTSADIDFVEALIAEAFEEVVLTAPRMERLSIEVCWVQLFGEELLPGASCVVATTARRALEEDIPSLSPFDASPMAEFATSISDWVTWASPGIERDDSVPLVDSIVGSPWLPWPPRLRLGFDVAVQHRLDQPFDGATVRDQLNEGPNDPDLSAALRLWFSNYPVAPADVWQATKAHSRPLLPGIEAALKAYSATASPKQIAELTAPMVRQLPGKAVDRQFLRACEYERAHAAAASALLVERAAVSIENDTNRGRILTAWAVLAPTDATTRTALIDGIAIPFIERAVDAAVALTGTGNEHLLKDPPRKVGPRLRTAIESKAKGTTSQKHLTKRMQELGITEKPSVLKRVTGFMSGGS